MPSEDSADAIANRTALRALARRHAIYTDEVRRLLDAGLEIMRKEGTAKSPRVSDIVEAAGLHREAFYRHFSSKEDLVSAIVEAGVNRLVSYLTHQMGKESSPEGQLRRWVEGIMAQSGNPEVAASTRAVLWNGYHVERPENLAAYRLVAELVVEPVTALGSIDPARDAAVLCQAVMGRQQLYLWERILPTKADTEHLIRFCLNAVG
jgi:AcrR family transcriptional regulator